MERARIETSARAAVSVFGGQLTLSDGDLDCNSINLDAEEFLETGAVDDGGRNRCSCKGEALSYEVLSSDLEAPSPPALPPPPEITPPDEE